MSIVPANDDSQITSFFDYIYGDADGFVYIARKNPADGTFNQTFFAWPEDKSALTSFVLNSRSQAEVYMAPALFDSADAKKASVKGSSVYWCEFDGNAPDPSTLTAIPPPTLRVQSSLQGHEHWYWRIDSFTDPDDLERVNRAITYLCGADTSGWDATQILRPVATFNHKREKEVILVEQQNVYLPRGLFSGLPLPPPSVEIERPDEIPPIEEVVFRYTFSDAVSNLFRNGVPLGERSTGEMRLGYYLAEMGMTNEEMLSIMLNADERWGKFKGRSDQVKRLLEIITIARQKHPYLVKSEEVGVTKKLKPLGFTALLATEVNVEWIWDGFLQRDGYMLMSGPSGIGKTQIALDAAAHMALGQNFLERSMRQTKVGFFSLEMGLSDIKVFLALQAKKYSLEEQEILEQNFLIFPLGEMLDLSKEAVMKEVDEVVGDFGLEGIIIDSLGASTSEALSDEAFRGFFHRMSALRQKHNCFNWFIHHMRKASGDNKKPNKLSDVFGSQYITSEATSVFCPWPGLYPSTLQLIPLKVRLSPLPASFHIHRDEELHFTHYTQGIGVIVPQDDFGQNEADFSPSPESIPGPGSPADDPTGASLDEKLKLT